MIRRGRDMFRQGLRGAVTLAVAVLVLVPGMAGCDREPAPPAEVTSQTEGAGLDHYLIERRGPGDQTAGLMPAAPPAPKPTGPLAANTSCVTAECHAALANAKYIHGPVSERACDSCHAADTGTHEFPLKRGQTETCTFCHAVAGTATHQHKALEQGCTACHRPHEGPTKFLLKGMSVEDLCARCHEVPLKRFAHAPFAQGECSTCHQPHQSDGPHLLRASDEATSCLACHQDLKKAMASPAKVHKPAGQGCTTCHTPHASETASQLKTSVAETCFTCHEDIQKRVSEAKVGHAAMLEEKSCANCHDPHASVQPHLLKERADATCLTCHDKPLTAADGRMIADMRASLKADFLHGPVKAANCSACHEVHGAPNDGLLRQSFPKSFYAPFDIGNYSLCFSCHEKELVQMEKTAHLTDFRDGDRNLHFVHVNREEKGRTCKTCHAVHGSNLPKHIATEVPMGDGKWSMPIGFEPAPEGGRCASGCHKPREYNRNRPATAPAASGGVR